MQFLKVLFWALLAFVAAVFTFGNWKWVQIQLFGNLVAEVNLPVLLLFTFLLGLVPTCLYHRAVRWRLSQRLTATERTLAGSQQQPVAATPPEPAPVAAPIAVPPGVA